MMILKTQTFRTLLLVLGIFFIVIGCKRQTTSKNVSRATGWQINSRDGGFQYNTNFQEQATPPGTVFVEGGTFTMGRVQDDVMHDWNNTPTQQSVQSFYMDETEVTNMMYLEYLDWIKRVYPPSDEKLTAIYNGALPDTLVWRNRLGYNEVATQNYLRHPAYAEYPVVGVSWIQAVEFANWRSDRVAELALEKAGYIEKEARLKVSADSTFSTETYLNAPSQAYGGNQDITNAENKSYQVNAAGDTIHRYARIQSGIIPPKYRLPTEAEWEYAALGLGSIRRRNLYRGRKKYPWEGKYTRSEKKGVLGDQLANFKQGQGDYAGIAGWSSDGAEITAQVKTYAPNDYGLYDMAGNVAEWVADVYRPIIDSDFNDFNYYRGNVYMKNAIGKDGKVEVVTANSIVYDTLPSGKLVARALPGELVKVPIGKNETYLRTNFDRSNEVNYRDGDKQSSRYFNQFDGGSAVNQTARMYNAPRHEIRRDSLGNLIREYDQSNSRTSLINDRVRVYKGGSWKDRVYWLDPAQRRYFPQDMATDYIGFRCAVSRVGSKVSRRRKR